MKGFPDPVALQASEMFPIMQSNKTRGLHYPHFIPMEALKLYDPFPNHRQAWERLKQRGGLTICELYAVCHSTKWDKVDFLVPVATQIAFAWGLTGMKKPTYLWIERNGTTGVSDYGPTKDHMLEFNELCGNDLRLFKIEDGKVQELVDAAYWEDVAEWLRI
jgi:hypothetical protein